MSSSRSGLDKESVRRSAKASTEHGSLTLNYYEAGPAEPQVVGQVAQGFGHLGHRDQTARPGSGEGVGQNPVGIGQVVQRHRRPCDVDGS